MTQGLVVKSYGRQFVVEVDGVEYTAVTRAKKTDYVVGDQVEVQVINSQQLQINGLLPRANLIYRMDNMRSKLIASNVTQISIVIALKPNFNINFLNSCLLFAQSEQIKPYIVINKSDLPDSKAFAKQIVDLYYNKLGYSVVSISALAGCSELGSLLEGEQSLLIGQSGVGKSSITNQIISHACAITASINKKETSGKHTTTSSTLYHINKTSSLIDCPGLQEFGLYHLCLETLPQLFPELENYIGKCRFRNCRHLNEPGCAIVEAYQGGKMDKIRFEFLTTLTEKLQKKLVKR